MINNSLMGKCDLFTDNFHILKKNFRWDYSLMLHFGALYYADANSPINVKAIKEAKKIIKKNAGSFSKFRDTTFFALAIMLSLSSDPLSLFQRSYTIYGDLKKAGFSSSPFLTLAAVSIAQNDLTDTGLVVLRAKDFYKAMKKKHGFLTSADDYVSAAMLALSDLEVEEAVREMESCYEILKKEYGSGNGIWSLAHILTLGKESAHEKCRRFMKIYDQLLQKGCKLNKHGQLSSLGILALIAEKEDKITEDIKNVYEVLLNKKGFGRWSLSKHQRTIYAASLVASDYINSCQDNTMNISLAADITGILAAQQSAMITAVFSSAAVIVSSDS